MEDKKALDILKEDQDAIRSLTAITQLEYFNLMRDISVLDISNEDKTALFKQSTGQLAVPSFLLNENISLDFYNLNRVNDLGEEFSFDVNSETDMSRESINSHLAQVGGMVNDKGSSLWERPETMAAMLLLIGGSLTKSYLQARSENYGKIGKRDRGYMKRVRVPNRRACSWCIRMALIDENRMVFHKNCRCSIGVFFEGSNKKKYSDQVFETYQADYSKVLGDLKQSGKPFTEEVILAGMRKEFGYR